MIKSDGWIRDNGSSVVWPFVNEQVNPASYDLTISRNIVDLVSGEKKTVSEIVLQPGDAILASTVEYLQMPNDVAGSVYLKSSLARLGLDHALAGWVDPGFEGTLTLELHCHRPIVLKVGQRVCQLVFMQLDRTAEQPYNGKYSKQVGPTEAR